MRRMLLAIGVGLVITGGIWILQGLDALKGSFMTGNPFWAWMGALAVLLGLPAITWGLRRDRHSR